VNIVFVLITLVFCCAILWLLFGNSFRYHILKQPKIGSYYKFSYNGTSSVVKVTGKDSGLIHFTILTIDGIEINFDRSDNYDMFLTVYDRIKNYD
jgi:hypothetical protein